MQKFFLIARKLADLCDIVVVEGMKRNERN
jgi:molybdopterin-guanine dinucleotide biosynthesis protein